METLYELAGKLYKSMSDVTVAEISKFPNYRKDQFNDLYYVLEKFLEIDKEA